MQIKTSKGYGKTTYVEVIEPLTLNDFIIEEEAPNHSRCGDYVSASLKLTLKEDQAEHLNLILPHIKQWKDDKQTTWARYFRRAVRFNGCRTQRAKDKKVEKIRQEMVVDMVDQKEERLEKLLNDVNQDLLERIRHKNEDYTNETLAVMSGRRMDPEWMSKHIDSTSIQKEIDEIEDQLKVLRMKKDKLIEDRQKHRNNEMLKYLDKNGWSDEDEDSGKVVFVPELREKLLDMYKKGEAFKVSRDWFLD